MTQAKTYATKLQTRFTYSTNGVGIYEVDMHIGVEGHILKYPTPDELWDRTFGEADDWHDRFSAVPFEDKSGTWEARYYQHNAIEATLAAIAKGQDRILLTLATGTGKTFIAFQLAWKLFHSRWNLSGEPTRRPRVLFLADRNILADQAYNSFSAFEDNHTGSLARIRPKDIRKAGRVPKNASIFITIVIERSNANIIGIEVKASASVKTQDFKGLATLAEFAGKSFETGILFYTGQEILPFKQGGMTFYALPIGLFSAKVQ